MTRTRIVALALIGVVALGLAYLKLGAAGDRVSVPAGAVGGDLILDPCTYSTENGSYAADCGTLVVPENREDPQSRLIAVPVTRIHARAENPGEPIFRLEGGPGLTNMKFARASRFAENHDVVLVGYRGVDGSVRLDCPEVESALKHSTNFLSEESFAAYAGGFRACAARLTAEGVDLDGYGLVQQADDLEAARKALGYERIDLLSESAGTRLAMIYAWRYPESVHRSVMIGVNPPGNYIWDPKITDEQIARYAKRCAEDESCSGRTSDLVATLRRTEIPGRWFFLPVKEANVKLASFFGLMETTPENAPLTGPMTIDSWLAAEDGDASAFWFQSLASDFLFPSAFVWGEFAAVGSVDARAVRDYFASQPEQYSNLGYAASAFIWGGGQSADAWPVSPDENEYGQVRVSEVETLLIGGEVDFSTPPQIATKELLPYLPNGHQVVLPGYGHSTSFWSDQPEAGTHLVNTFLDTGRIDDSLYKPQPVDFTPEVSQPALGKGIAGGIVGLAALVVLSLLWMPLRLRKRRRFGRKSSAMLRSLYAIVLGLGGWFAGILLVMTTRPGTPLDTELLAVLGVGVPVGLSIYWAWVHRDWQARIKATGFAAAAGGTLVGAWLGFHAAGDLLALVTAIVGAVAGTNLALICLDIAWDRQLRDRFTETKARETPEASPSKHAAVRPHHGLQTLTALCLATTLLAAWASSGAAAGPPQAAQQTATPRSVDRPYRHPGTDETCPAPFGNEDACRTATPRSAERMLRRHRVTLRSEACPPPFAVTTRCGVATVPANWAKRHGRRTLEIWYAWVPAPSGTSTGVTVPFMGGPGDAISEVADLFLALVPALPDRDMLIVDVRGTGRSGRLSCPTVDTAQWRPAGQEQVDAVARCAQEIGRRRDDYTTVGSVFDVEAIRRALHLPKPSLLGVSYGTWVVQTYTVLFPELVQAAVIDGIVPFDLDPWGRTYTDGMQRVLRLRCERTTLCDPAEADARVRRVAASLAAQPVPFPNSTRLLTEGDFSAMSIVAIQFNFAEYLSAVDRALEGDYEPLLALTEAANELPPPNPIGSSVALEIPVACNEYSAPFDLDDKLSKRQVEFDRRLAELPDNAFGWFSKQGWVDSAWEQVDFCLEYPRPRFSPRLRPPYLGPFPEVPVLMLNGDIDLQTPLESARRAKKNWPNRVFLTIKDATHVTISNNECAVAIALGFLADPVFPAPGSCDSEPASK